MKLSKLIQIIKEELENFYDYSDEQGMADRYFEKNYGTQTTTPPTTPEIKINAELIGYIDKQWSRPLNVPIPLYKNPPTLEGFYAECRGVLLNNGDFYVAPTPSAMHDNILDLLGQKGIVPYGKVHQYFDWFPDEFIAVQRVGKTNTFAQSSAYDKFPEYYQEIFELASKKQPFQFKSYNYNMDEILDPNNMISYFPQGYKHNILDEKGRGKV